MGRAVSPLFFARMTFAALLALLPAAARACDPSRLRVVVDVGHTDVSPGAISARGTTEHAFNRYLADLVGRQLQARGVGAVLPVVRTGREDLSARAAAINALAPDLILSIHHDSVQAAYQQPWAYEGRTLAYSDRFKGWSLLISTASRFGPENRRLAGLIADRLLASGMPFSTHHAEPIAGEGRPFVDRSRGIYRYDNLAVLKFASAPAVLVEAGIILNRDEELALATEARQSRNAAAIAEGVSAYCRQGFGPAQADAASR